MGIFEKMEDAGDATPCIVVAVDWLCVAEIDKVVLDVELVPVPEETADEGFKAGETATERIEDGATFRDG